LATTTHVTLKDATPPPSPHARRRILVVDDNHDAADTLAMMLELLGHEVRRAYDPHQVTGMVGDFKPDLVLLDVGMPGLSGHVLATRLRGLPGGEALQIVAVTGWGQDEDRQRSREAGFDHHLVKPPSLQQIKRLCDGPPAGPLEAGTADARS